MSGWSDYAFGSMPSYDSHLKDNPFISINSTYIEDCRRLSEKANNSDNFYEEMKQDYLLTDEKDEKLGNECHSPFRDGQNLLNNFDYNDCGDKVLIEERCKENSSHYFYGSFSTPIFDRKVEMKFSEWSQYISPKNQNCKMGDEEMEDKRVKDDNGSVSVISGNITETVSTTEEAVQSKYSLPSSLSSFSLSSSSDEILSPAKYSLPSSINQSSHEEEEEEVSVLDKEGKLIIPDPANIRKNNNVIKGISNKQEYRNEIENPDFYYKIFSEDLIERNHISSPKQVKIIRKHLYQEPDGSVYTIPTDTDKKEIEERLNGSLMPPQPEYFDVENVGLGYKCCYDVEHPHPYRNPFEMFVYVDKNGRRKLKSSRKYSVNNLSNGRIICLACALIHSKEIGTASQLQDWDVIDTNGGSLRQCKSCKKNKKAMHFKQKRLYKQCTFCASHRTFTRERKNSDNG